MRQYVSVKAILLIAVMVHVDWHVGRPHHISSLSGDWPYHWILGVLTFAALGLFAGLKWPDRPYAPLALNAVAGLFVGHIVEALGEVLAYRESWALVMPAERWRLFFEFAAAGVAGCLLGLGFTILRRRTATGATLERS
jgi:hypothetical protein